LASFLDTVVRGQYSRRRPEGYTCELAGLARGILRAENKLVLEPISLAQQPLVGEDDVLVWERRARQSGASRQTHLARSVFGRHPRKCLPPPPGHPAGHLAAIAEANDSSSIGCLSPQLGGRRQGGARHGTCRARRARTGLRNTAGSVPARPAAGGLVRTAGHQRTRRLSDVDTVMTDDWLETHAGQVQAVETHGEPEEGEKQVARRSAIHSPSVPQQRLSRSVSHESLFSQDPSDTECAALPQTPADAHRCEHVPGSAHQSIIKTPVIATNGFSDDESDGLEDATQRSANE
jgi:hypothetical protein